MSCQQMTRNDEKITAHEKSYLKAVTERDFYKAECERLAQALEDISYRPPGGKITTSISIAESALTIHRERVAERSGGKE